MTYNYSSLLYILGVYVIRMKRLKQHC